MAIAVASARSEPTAARIASTSEPEAATSASPSASIRTLRYEVCRSAARTVVFVASIPRSLAIVVCPSLLDSPVHDRSRRVRRLNRGELLRRRLPRRLVVARAAAPREAAEAVADLARRSEVDH